MYAVLSKRNVSLYNYAEGIREVAAYMQEEMPITTKFYIAETL